MSDDHVRHGMERTEVHGDGSLQGSRSSSAARTAEVVRGQAGAIWSEAKDKARSTLDQQQKSAAEGIGDFASALRNAAGTLESRDKTSVAHFGHRAADGLEHLATTLRSKDPGTMLRDIESFARREPALFLGAAVALGFVAMRFLKSSGEQSETESHAGEEAQPVTAATSRPAGSATNI